MTVGTLQAALKNSEEKMGRLQQQWNAHREPLNDQLSCLTQEMEDKKVSNANLTARCVYLIVFLCEAEISYQMFSWQCIYIIIYNIDKDIENGIKIFKIEQYSLPYF